MLYYRRPVMVTSNLDVANEIANGTRAFVSQVHLKAGEQASSLLIDGLRIQAVRVCQVDRVTLRRETRGDEPPSFFDITASQTKFVAKLPIPDILQGGGRSRRTIERLRMSGTQFPIICNNATTGHKLQGAGVENLFVHTWSSTRNWVYVVLSRVKRMKGLYLRFKMDKRLLSKYNEIPEELNDMIRDFRENKMRTALSAVEYDDVLGKGWSL
jgi:hypothetical protein